MVLAVMTSPLQSRVKEKKIPPWWHRTPRLSGLSMRSVVDQLWPGRSKPNSYFSLVQQVLDVVPHINAMRRLACIEGARMAFARVKAYWAEMDATTVAARDSAIGRMAAEHYFEEVLEGARLIETQCSKNIMFE